MSKIKEIADYLNTCTNDTASDGAAGTGLRNVHKIVFNHKNNFAKAEMVKDLSKFYADDYNILDVWHDLSECERDFVSYIVRYNGNEYLATTIEYAKKYNLPLEYKDKWGYTKKLLDDYQYKYTRLKFLTILKQNIPNTKAVVLFPSGKDMPPFVLEVLKQIVEPLTFEFGEYILSPKDYIICREDRLGDFAAVVKFSGSEQLKVIDRTFDITKSKLAKLSETAGFEEVCDNDGKFCTPKETKRNNDFKVAAPLFALAADSGLLDIDGAGNVLPGEKSLEMLSMPRHELAKNLFDDYMKNNKIYELHYVTYITTYDGDANIKWHECRKPIIDLLKNCPVDKFVRFQDLDKYAKIFCGNFFRKLLRGAVTIRGYKPQRGYYYGYDEPDWDECEAQIIRTILSFLSVIGMVDAAYTENIPRIKHSKGDYCVGITGFRITKLGAWILGLTEKYEYTETAKEKNDDGGLLVLPDYSVIISGLKHRIEYETYLSKFLSKPADSIDENVAVYRLDFQAAIRAFDMDIPPQKIKAYLKKASIKPLPENVERSLEDWQTKVGRIKIRNLTVLETDDVLLLEEIKHIKGMDNIVVSELKNAVAIDGGKTKKAKTIIEKNGWLVKI